MRRAMVSVSGATGDAGAFERGAINVSGDLGRNGAALERGASWLPGDGIDEVVDSTDLERGASWRPGDGTDEEVDSTDGGWIEVKPGPCRLSDLRRSKAGGLRKASIVR